MDNKIKIPEIPKNNSIKLHRNATLDSTSSSIKNNKKKLYDSFTPLVNITKKTNFKQKLDFPVFMSLYTNQVPKNENEENKKPPSKRKFILKNIKNFSTKNLLISNQTEIKKELILPKPQHVISRNENYSTNNILNEINTTIKNYLRQIKFFNFQSSRNISKPKLKKINQDKLTKFTQRSNPTIKTLKMIKLDEIGKQNIKSYNFEISEIKDKKRIFRGLKLNSIKKLSTIKNNLLKEAIEKEDVKNNFEEVKENLPSKEKINEEKISEEKTNKEEKIYNDNNKNNNEENNNKNPTNSNSELKKINQKSIIKSKNKNPINSIILNKINDNNQNDVNNKFKDKKIILDLNTKKPSEIVESSNKKNEENNLLFLSSRSDRESKSKNDIFNINNHNQKINKVYKKSKFLNKLNEEFTDSLISKRININIQTKKQNIINKTKNEYNNIIIKEYNKITNHTNHFLSKPEIQKMMSAYIKEIYNEKNRIIIYKETYIYLITRKIQNVFNCIIGSDTRDYIFKKYESNRMSLTEKLKKEETNQDSLIQSFRLDKTIRTMKRKSTFIPNLKKEHKKNDSEGVFTVEKTHNVKLRHKRYLGNFIFVQELILKSLPFYKENYIKLVNLHHQQLMTRNRKRYINFGASHKSITKFFNMNSFDSLTKKNSLNSIQSKGSYRRKKGEKRTASVLKIENIRKTLRIQSKPKAENKESNISVLKQKHFFKKLKTNFEHGVDSTEKESSKSQEKDKTDSNELDPNIENIYFQLMKALFEGKNKFFQNFYLKNKKFIDINQVLIEGNTLLLLAAREGNYQITKFLCEEQADVNIQNADGNTALHYAIGKQFYSIADLLNMYGAKEDLLNLKGLSPWDCIEHNVD